MKPRHIYRRKGLPIVAEICKCSFQIMKQDQSSKISRARHETSCTHAQAGIEQTCQWQEEVPRACMHACMSVSNACTNAIYIRYWKPVKQFSLEAKNASILPCYSTRAVQGFSTNISRYIYYIYTSSSY
jgi:hypothetical protein